MQKSDSPGRTRLVHFKGSAGEHGMVACLPCPVLLSHSPPKMTQARLSTQQYQQSTCSRLFELGERAMRNNVHNLSSCCRRDPLQPPSNGYARITPGSTCRGMSQVRLGFWRGSLFITWTPIDGWSWVLM